MAVINRMMRSFIFMPRLPGGKCGTATYECKDREARPEVTFSSGTGLQSHADSWYY